MENLKRRAWVIVTSAERTQRIGGEGGKWPLKCAVKPNSSPEGLEETTITGFPGTSPKDLKQNNKHLYIFFYWTICLQKEIPLAMF